MKKVIWHGSRKCEFCGKEITEGLLYDACTKWGLWATMCHSCYVRNGIGVGIGKGQQYALNDDGEFQKTDG